MKFTTYRGTSKETLAIPRAALQFSGLASAERLSLRAGRSCIVFTRQVPTIRGRLKSIRLLHDLNVSMVYRLALDSRTASDIPCKRTSEIFQTYDAEFLDMPEHCGVKMDGLARLFGKEAAADR